MRHSSMATTSEAKSASNDFCSSSHRCYHKPTKESRGRTISQRLANVDSGIRTREMVTLASSHNPSWPQKLVLVSGGVSFVIFTTVVGRGLSSAMEAIRRDLGMIDTYATSNQNMRTIRSDELQLYA